MTKSKINVSFYGALFPVTITTMLQMNNIDDMRYDDVTLEWEIIEQDYGVLLFKDKYTKRTILDLDYNDLEDFFARYVRDCDISSAFLFRTSFFHTEEFLAYPYDNYLWSGSAFADDELDDNRYGDPYDQRDDLPF